MLAPEGMFEATDKEIVLYILDYQCNELTEGSDELTAWHDYDNQM